MAFAVQAIGEFVGDDLPDAGCAGSQELIDAERIVDRCGMLVPPARVPEGSFVSSQVDVVFDGKGEAVEVPD